MKKIISSILVICLIMTSFGTVGIFADEEGLLGDEGLFSDNGFEPMDINLFTGLITADGDEPELDEPYNVPEIIEENEVIEEHEEEELPDTTEPPEDIYGPVYRLFDGVTPNYFTMNAYSSTGYVYTDSVYGDGQAHTHSKFDNVQHFGEFTYADANNYGTVLVDHKSDEARGQQGFGCLSAYSYHEMDVLKFENNNRTTKIKFTPINSLVDNKNTEVIYNFFYLPSEPGQGSTMQITVHYNNGATTVINTDETLLNTLASNDGGSGKRTIPYSLGTYYDLDHVEIYINHTGQLVLRGITFQTDAPAPANEYKLRGIAMGPSYSYAYGNLGYDLALDEKINSNTTYDNNDRWVGLNLGSPRHITKVKFYPVNDQLPRMRGCVIQGSNSPNFASPTTLYTITSSPAAGWNTIPITDAGTYQYVRIYKSGDILDLREIEFYSDTLPSYNIAPQGTFSSTNDSSHVSRLNNSTILYDLSDIWAMANNTSAEITCDFTGTATVDGVNVFVDAGTGPLTMNLSYLDNGSYQPISYTCEKPTNDDGSFTQGLCSLRFNSSVTTSSIKISLTTRGSYGTNITEIEVLGVLSNPVPTPEPTATPTPAPTPTVSPSPSLGKKLTGLAYGTPYTSVYQYGSGNISVFNEVYDGDEKTIADYQGTDNTGYAALDLGTAKRITGIRFYPRYHANGDNEDRSERMVGGKFQGANDRNFTNPVDLYTVPSNPNDNWTEVTITNINHYRYVRYIGAKNSYCNVAEVEFYSNEASDNIAPSATPSTNYTFDRDNIAHLTDGIISYTDDNPRNRWSSYNYNLSGSPYIQFDYTNNVRISGVNLYFYVDSGYTKYPPRINITYGTDTPVSVISSEPADLSNMTNKVRRRVTVSFTRIETSSLKIELVGADGNYVGITEAEIIGSFDTVSTAPPAPTTFIEDFTELDKSDQSYSGETGTYMYDGANYISGSHKYTGISASANGWVHQYKNGYRTGANTPTPEPTATAEPSVDKTSIGGYYDNYLEGARSTDNEATNHNSTITLTYGNNYEGKDLEIRTSLSNTCYNNYTYGNSLANYKAHYNLQVTVNGQDMTENLMEVVGRVNEDLNGPPVVLYTFNALPEGPITVTVTGDWRHKLLSVIVKDHPATLRKFEDDFSSIDRIPWIHTKSIEGSEGDIPYTKNIMTTAPHDALFLDCYNISIHKDVDKIYETHPDIDGYKYGSANANGNANVLYGRHDYKGDSYIIYKGDFGGLSAKIVFGVDQNAFEFFWKDIYPCSNVEYSKWDYMREFIMQDNLHIWASTDGGATYTDCGVVQWDGRSLTNKVVTVIAYSAELPPGTTHLKIDKRGDIDWWVRILKIATVDKRVANTDYVTVPVYRKGVILNDYEGEATSSTNRINVGYPVDGTGNIYYDFNDMTMDLYKDIQLDSFHFINAYVNTTQSSYNTFNFWGGDVTAHEINPIIKVTSSDPRVTEGVKIKIDKVTTGDPLSKGLIRQSYVAGETAEAYAQRSSTTVDRHRHLYGVLVAKDVGSTDTEYTAMYERYSTTDDTVHGIARHTFEFSGLEGTVNFGLTFNRVPDDVDIRFAGDDTTNSGGGE